jgi:hypothetical protein
MQKFIKWVSIFVFPVLIIFVVGEILIRNIPNDYTIKRKYLEKNASSVKILCLGSSHAYFDINPAYFKKDCYNAAYVSQTVNYDYKIYEKYDKRLDSLKWIILPISYFTFFSKIETSPESWRIKDYSIYSELNGDVSRFIYYEMLSYSLSVNLERIFNYYYYKSNSNLTCTNSGFGINYGKKNINLDSAGYVAALRHTKYMNEANFSYNEEAVKNLILLAKKNGVNIILYTPPAWHTYSGNINKRLLNITIDTVNGLCKRYSNVSYLNYLNDKSFQRDDFLDADHLNGKGAKKLSVRIDSLINRQS